MPVNLVRVDLGNLPFLIVLFKYVGPIYLFIFVYLFLLLGRKACGILGSPTKIEPVSPAVRDEVLTTGLLGNSKGNLSLRDGQVFSYT